MIKKALMRDGYECEYCGNESTSKIAIIDCERVCKIKKDRESCDCEYHYESFVQSGDWHIAKLNHALLSGDESKIKEYSCDVGNICEKAYTTKIEQSQTKKVKSSDCTYDEAVGAGDCGDY